MSVVVVGGAEEVVGGRGRLVVGLGFARWGWRVLESLRLVKTWQQTELTWSVTPWWPEVVGYWWWWWWWW